MSDRAFLNHVEMVYAPGGRETARAFFELLGFTVRDTGHWLTIAVEPSEAANWADNTLYAQEATPAQLRFEDEFAKAIESNSALSEALDHYKDVRRAHPQLHFHWGIHLPSHEDWEARVARVREAAESHPVLKGHVEALVFEPEKNPHAISPQSQAFIRTDVLAAEGFPFGLEIELQWTPVDEDGNLPTTSVGYFPSEDELA